MLTLSVSGLGASPARAATFERVSGSDRFATAAAISRDAFSPGVDAVYVVTGLDFPDALAAAPAAAAEGAPLLLVTATEVPQATGTELARLRPKRVVIVGDQNSVSEQVAAALDEHTTGPVVRRQGADRFATAAAVATESFQPGVGAAFIANGLNFPDGLGGGAAAGELGGPVLFAERDTLPSATAQALQTLRPSSIIILGGMAAVSSTVEGQLARYSSSVTRYAGPNRFTTSAAIASAVFPQETDTVYLATGGSFPDALAGGAAAASAGAPLLLTNRDCLPAAVDAQIDRLNPDRVVVLGGGSAVSDSVLSRTPCPEPAVVLEHDLYALDGHCSRYGYGWNSWGAPGRIAGQSFNHVVFCHPEEDPWGFVEYDIGRQYGALEAVAGQRDDSESTSETIEFRVVVDGVVVVKHELPFGERKLIRVPLVNGLRLRLEWTVVGAGERYYNPDAPIVAWGDPRLLP